MRKNLFLIMIAVICLGGKVYAQQIVEVHNKFCPISGEEVGSGGMTPYKIVHKGKAYFLCCAMCKEDFLKDPDKYAKMLDEQAAQK